ncbi:MAG: FHA domain-containing protein [Candidatus Hydrogenedentota bacterium]
MYDEFEVINGPEDGATHSVGRVPCWLGADPECTVQVGTDPLLRARHARITAASGGYRFRRVEGDDLFVNGRAVGKIRSRIAREGDVVRAGNTFFVLRCATEGLANRSRGIAPDSDLLFLFGKLMRWLRLCMHASWRLVKRAFRNVLSIIITVLVILALLSFFLPQLRYTVTHYLYVIKDYAQGLLQQL